MQMKTSLQTIQIYQGAYNDTILGSFVLGAWRPAIEKQHISSKQERTEERSRE